MKKITPDIIEEYRKFLYEEEKAEQTIKKYIRDINKLAEYAGEHEITKELMISWKSYLLNERQYKPSSINSFLAAANRLFEYKGWYDVRVKTLKVQDEVFVPEKKELGRHEYNTLVSWARKEGKSRLAMIIQTICATGIRVSELKALTVASVRNGMMEVNNKGKIRKVLISGQLRGQLLLYIAKENIKKGMVFCTKSGRPVDRRNIWRDMKHLCKVSGIDESKVFPHNLRRLFARTFYSIENDISKLADMLGHSMIDTTRIYLRTSSGECRKLLDRMNLILMT